METTDGLFGERARHGLWVLESSSAGALVVVPPAVSRQCPVRWVRCGARGSLFSAFCLVRRNVCGITVGLLVMSECAGQRPSNCPPLATFKTVEIPPKSPTGTLFWRCGGIVDVLIVAN